MSYEEQQAKLQVLWNEMLSDESGDFSPDVSEYEPSSASVDGDDQFASNKGSRAKKRTKKLHVVGPSKKKPQLSVNEQNKTKMLNTTSSYWSQKFLYHNNLRDVLPRNRFQMLFKTWHFADNTTQHHADDRLYKITPLLNVLRESFQSKVVPGEYLCIDETLVPFKGRLKFKQYISNKRHKFGIKLLKLCLKGGYLYDLKVYCGQENDKERSETVPTKVVMNLVQQLLGKGRTLCTDNDDNDEKTYLLGTLRSNRKNMFGKIWVNELNSADKIPVTSLFDQQEQPAEIYLPKEK
jgi:hypothetical protein